MFEIVSTLPKEGQFIKVWEYGGKIWSDTFKWEDGELYCGIDGGERWDNFRIDEGFCDDVTNIRYIVLKREVEWFDGGNNEH